MKSLVLTLSCSLLLVGSTVLAQGYTFKVLANKGSNKVKSGTEWKPLKTGASLKKGDELKISDNAYLGLIHNTGKTLEIKKSGNHKVAELASRIKTGGTSVASKYADFVLSKMSAEKKGERLNATGAVHRATTNSKIKIHIPNSVEVYNQEALVEWAHSDKDKTYELHIVNMFGDELLKVETTDHKYNINLNNDKLKNEAALLVTINVKGDKDIKSEEVAIKRLPSKKASQVKQSLSDLMGEVDTKTALNNYILAGFYEENSLLLDAIFFYKKAIKLAPGVDSYKEAYEEFLFRNSLN